MLSIITSGLNAAQKDLSVTANNLANASTTGFKRSDTSFMDIYSSDPTVAPSTEIGGGTALGDISRSTSQGPLKTTGNVTDLAITGRGFFTLARDDGSAIYTRAGNFTANTDGVIVDSQGNQLQAFKVDQTIDPITKLPSGAPLLTQPTTNVVIPLEKSPGKVRVNLNENVGAGTNVTINFDGGSMSRPATAAELVAGFMSFQSPDLNSTVGPSVAGSFDVTPLSVPISNVAAGGTMVIKSGDTIIKSVPLKGSETSPLAIDIPTRYAADFQAGDISAEFDSADPAAMPVVVAASDIQSSGSANRSATTVYQPNFTQGLSIDTKGMISVNFSDGTSSPIGALAIANFPYEPGLKAVGATNFVQSVDSGAPVMSQAGSPAAGDIRSGVLEESNVDMTDELTQMLKAQQVYNGNARMMQTSVDMVSRIVDKL